MKNILDVIPETGAILDNLVSTPEEKRAAELKLREIDAREMEARLGVQKAWLSNDSFFVAGAIPSMLWMVSLVVAFNCIVAPMLSPWVTLSTLALPDWYAEAAVSVVFVLMGKKTIDGAEIRWNGETVKLSRKRIEAEVKAEIEARENRSQAAVPPKPAAQAAPKPGKDTAKPPAPEATAETSPAPKGTAAPKRSYESPEEVDARLREIASEKGIAW